MAGKAMHLCAHALFICSFVVFCMGVFKFSQALARISHQFACRHRDSCLLSIRYDNLLTVSL